MATNETVSKTDDLCEKFGKNIRHEFQLRDGSVFINHGSYGTVPRKVLDKQIKFLQEMDSHPDDWFRRKSEVYWREAITAVAEFVHTRPEDTFLVQNATKGVNTVLKSYPLKPGDAILITCLTYPAVNKTAYATTERRDGTDTVIMEIKFPIVSEDSVVEQFDQYLKEHPNVKIAVIDHITSPTAVLMPVKRISEVLHKHGVTVVIDGAHGPGQLPLNIPEYGADFYTGNFHKWVFCPRGCAVLWKNPKTKCDWLTSLVTAYHHGKGLHREFRFEGTKDDSPYFCVKEAIKFYNDLGGLDEIASYNTTLATKARDYLEKQWGTERLQIPPSMESPYMKVVRCPDLKGYPKTMEGFEQLMDDRFYKHDLQTCIILVEGEICIRISAQVYNVIHDYTKVADVITNLICETKPSSS